MKNQGFALPRSEIVKSCGGVETGRLRDFSSFSGRCSGVCTYTLELRSGSARLALLAGLEALRGIFPPRWSAGLAGHGRWPLAV